MRKIRGCINGRFQTWINLNHSKIVEGEIDFKTLLDQYL